MKLWCLLWVLCSYSALTQAGNYVIGIEEIDYYPHYDFSRGQKRGYFVDLMKLFENHSGHTFKFEPLPVKRLYHSSTSGIDLIYPDNPKWQQYLEAGVEKHYSDPVIYTLGSTLVRPEQQHIHLNQFRTLAVIHGFAPTKWLALQSRYNYRIVDVPDVASALGLVLKGRLDGANIEYNVAQHYLRGIQQQDKLVIGEFLPFTQLPFLISTAKYPELIQEFNLFLQEKAAEVAALKRLYQLQEQRPTPVAQQLPETQPDS